MYSICINSNSIIYYYRTFEYSNHARASAVTSAAEQQRGTPNLQQLKHTHMRTYNIRIISLTRKYRSRNILYYYNILTVLGKFFMLATCVYVSNRPPPVKTIRRSLYDIILL